MRAIDCPACGATLPISLALSLPGEATARCAACATSVPLPADVTAQIAEGRAVLERLSERERQLDAAGRRALASSSSAGLRTLGVLAATLVPLAACTAGAGVLLLGQEVPSFTLFAFFAAPLVAGIVVAVLGMRALRRVGLALELAVAAQPPSRPGESACCRVCGGPLVAGTQALVRCEHCRADNLVSAPALARASAARSADLDLAAGAITARASGLVGAARRVRLLGAATVVAAPLVSFATLVTTTLVAGAVEVAPHRLEYAMLPTSAGRCVALVSRYSDHVRISYGGTAIPYEDRPNVAGLELRGPEIMAAGTRVKTLDSGRPSGVVSAVFGDLLGGNYARLRLDGGSEVVRPLAGLCLAD